MLTFWLSGTARTEKRGEAVENIGLPDLAAFEEQDHPIASRQGRTACAKGHARIQPMEEGKALEAEPMDDGARCVAAGDAERADRMAVQHRRCKRGEAVGQFAPGQVVVLVGEEMEKHVAALRQPGGRAGDQILETRVGKVGAADRNAMEKTRGVDLGGGNRRAAAREHEAGAAG